MVVYLTSTICGYFATDKDGQVLVSEVVYPDVTDAATEFVNLGRGGMTEGLRRIVTKMIENGHREIVVEDRMLARALSEFRDLSVSVDEQSREIKWFRSLHDSMMLERGIVSSEEDLRRFRHSVSLLVAEVSLREACRERDLLVKQAINAVDDLNKSINIITMRAKEWYSFHSPSVSMIVDDPEVLSQIITGEYDHTELESRLAELGHPTTIFESLSKSELNRIGGALSETDIEAIRSLGKLIGVLLQVKRGLEHYVELMMREVAPNLSALVEPLVAARLIDGAGSLADLARRPSSTVQVLGAERALFRSLRTGTAPPKHGLIFQLPEVHSAPLWQRGRIARAFAGKIAIAARVDAYSKRDVSEQLRQDLERRLIEIRNRSRPRLTHATTTRSRPSTEKGTRTGRRKAPRKRGGRNN